MKSHSLTSSFTDSRFIWRAGAKRDAAAAPRLLELLRACSPHDERKLYALAWALGRVGDPAALPALRVLGRQSSHPTARRMANEAYRALLSGDALAEFQQQCRASLPASLQTAMTDATSLASAVASHIRVKKHGHHKNTMVLHTLYLVDDDMCRDVLVQLLPTLPIRRGVMQPIRYIFKAAEYREDPLFFGLLVRRFDECMASGADGTAWSIGTRTYLRRRAWRTLRRMAERGDTAGFSRLSLGVLLAYNRQNLQARLQTKPIPGPLLPNTILRGQKPPQLCDEAYAFNRILFGQRLPAAAPGTGAFRIAAARERQAARGRPERVEAFPRAWDAAPEALLTLLMDSDVADVISFASRALEDNPGFCSTFTTEQVLTLLQRPTLSTVVLGFSRLLSGDLVAEGALLDAAFGAMYRLLASKQDRLVKMAISWLGSQGDSLLTRPAAAARLLSSPHAGVRVQVRSVFDAAQLSPDAQHELFGALLSALAAAPPEPRIFDEIRGLIERVFPTPVRAAPESVIQDLLSSGSVRLEAYAAQLLLARTGHTPAWSTIQGMLDASSPFARRVGLGYINTLDDDTLRAQQRQIVALVTHEMSDVRVGVRVLIRRMIGDAAQAVVLAEELLSVLPGQPAHIAASLEETITVDLAATIAAMMAAEPEPLRQRIPALLQRGASAPVCRVGLWLLALQGDTILLEEQGLLLSLSSHDNAALRESVRPLLKGLAERHPDFGVAFAEQLLGRMLSPVFGGGAYNVHFVPPAGESASSWTLDSYALSRRRQGWPDNDGGLLQAPPHAPIELIGASVNDRLSGWASIGFDFMLAGTLLRRFQASTNGWIRFDGTWKGSYDHREAWGRSTGVGMFPWWSDLKTASDGHVRTWTTGEPGAGVRVIEWRVWPHYTMRAHRNLTLTFQVCLFEDGQRIEYRYGHRDTTGTPNQARAGAVGLKLNTKARVAGQVRDFFGMHGTPPGSKPAFRTNLACIGDDSNYPGDRNVGLLSGTNTRALRSIQERFKDIAQTLLEAFSPVLRAMPLARVEGLLAHSLVSVQELGARILLDHQTPAADIPPHLIQLLLGSPHARIRSVGVDLIGKLSTASLLASPALIHELATHEKVDIRRKAQELVERLVQADSAFGAGLVQPLLEHLDHNPGHAGEVGETLRLILKYLPLELLRDNDALLLSGVLHALPDVRKAFRIVSRRVVEGDLAFCLRFSQAVLDGAGRMGSVPGDVRQLSSELIIVLRDLLAALPEEDLLDEDLIYGLCSHAHPQMRKAAGPLLDRVMVHEPALAVAVGTRLLKLVKRDEPDTPGEVHIRRLLQQLSDDAAIRHPSLIVQAIRTGRSGLSEAAVHRMRALVAAHGVGQMFTDALLSMLFWGEPYEGAHVDIIDILKADLASFLGGVPARSVWRLLKARTVPAMDLGALLLAQNFRAEQISLKKLGELSDHKLHAVRRAAWSFYDQSVARLREDIGAGLGILDADWDDSREFAFRFFSANFDEDVLTAEVLVGIVDSIRPDVQDFGRKMIGRMFGDEDGPTYLLRLSQHPVPNVELFVTNYLDRYAAGQPERLRTLVPYFRRVLTRVNRGRAAKARVLLFLRQEMARSAEMAAIVAELLAWLSVMEQVGDRATVLEMMLDLTERYPELTVPITVQATPHHGGRDAV